MVVADAARSGRGPQVESRGDGRGEGSAGSDRDSRQAPNLFSIGHGTFGEYVFKTDSSVDGTGAAISQFRISGSAGSVTGTSVTTIYFHDGVSKQRGSFKQAAPSANGIMEAVRRVRDTGSDRRALSAALVR